MSNTILKTGHLPRYTEIGRMLWRYGRVLRKWDDTHEPMADGGSADKNELAPDTLTRDLEKMGPTFVKLGQLLASRADLLPDPYLQALSRLQDRVEPFPFEQVEAIVQTELGARLSKAFSEFESKPLAAASLGQVHRARLRDGREVAVKVQRPNIREKITEDLELLEEVATFLQQHTTVGRQHRLVEILDQFRRTLFQELDYQREASNLAVIGQNLREFEHIQVATPIPDYTTRAVLTMDYVSGQKITEIGPLVRLDVDVRMLADELFTAYLKQVLVDGVFHADPHPGNIFLTENGCLSLLDLGMVGRITPGMQESLISSCWRLAKAAVKMPLSSRFRSAKSRTNSMNLYLNGKSAPW
jgi:ubiquinone biosynthesis protein